MRWYGQVKRKELGGVRLRHGDVELRGFIKGRKTLTLANIGENGI